ATYFGASADDGGFFRFKAEYDLTDSIKLSGGIIFYESGGNGALKSIGDSDRIFCSVKYSF
ncbi:MAG: ligand-binding protein SH3, partial [Desulfobacula sp.]|nr:ligand-binding protein SH3 [Desulfobacula sp.]